MRRWVGYRRKSKCACARGVRGTDYPWWVTDFLREGPRVAVITDSTASLPDSLRVAAGLRVVNLHVLTQTQSFEENADITPDRCAHLLTQHQTLTTSQPTREDFEKVLTRVWAEGYESAVMVLISSGLSGTVDTARLVAENSSRPVEVVDSLTAGMALGLAALAAARAADEGRPAKEVALVASRVAATSGAFFMVDSLDYLRRGGRLGAAAAAVGTVLGLKPILTIDDSGQIVVAAKVRTRTAALAYLRERALDGVREGAGAIALHYFGDAERAHTLADELRAEVTVPVHVSSASAVLGSHVGPGLVAVTFAN